MISILKCLSVLAVTLFTNTFNHAHSGPTSKVSSFTASSVLTSNIPDSLSLRTLEVTIFSSKTQNADSLNMLKYTSGNLWVVVGVKFKSNGEVHFKCSSNSRFPNGARTDTTKSFQEVQNHGWSDFRLMMSGVHFQVTFQNLYDRTEMLIRAIGNVKNLPFPICTIYHIPSIHGKVELAVGSTHENLDKFERLPCTHFHDPFCTFVRGSEKFFISQAVFGGRVEPQWISVDGKRPIVSASLENGVYCINCGSAETPNNSMLTPSNDKSHDDVSTSRQEIPILYNPDTGAPYFESENCMHDPEGTSTSGAEHLLVIPDYTNAKPMRSSKANSMPNHSAGTFTSPLKCSKAVINPDSNMILSLPRKPIKRKESYDIWLPSGDKRLLEVCRSFTETICGDYQVSRGCWEKIADQFKPRSVDGVRCRRHKLRKHPANQENYSSDE